MFDPVSSLVQNVYRGMGRALVGFTSFFLAVNSLFCRACVPTAGVYAFFEVVGPDLLVAVFSGD